jgi:hypothetical protein
MGWIRRDDCQPSRVCQPFAAECSAMKDLQRPPTNKLACQSPKLTRLGSVAELTKDSLCVQPGGKSFRVPAKVSERLPERTPGSPEAPFQLTSSRLFATAGPLVAVCAGRHATRRQSACPPPIGFGEGRRWVETCPPLGGGDWRLEVL